MDAQLTDSKSLICRRGGIGRRNGLKIRWGKPRTGSSPVAGTTTLLKGMIPMQRMSVF